MIKRSIIYVVVVCLGIIGIGNMFDIDTRLEKMFRIEKIEINLSEIEEKVLEGNGIKAIYDTNQQLKEVQVLDKAYQIDTIAVGDSVHKIYEVYDTSQIIEYENHIKVLKGTKEHYGVATEYITYVKGNEDKIQEIRKGYTASFTDIPLLENNELVKEQLQGTWKEEKGHILKFQEKIVEDNFSNEYWKEQNFSVIAPNKILIRRITEGYVEKIEMYIWLDQDKLYLFAIDSTGIPIKESIECFKKQ